MSIGCYGRVVFQNKGGTKNFPGVIIDGNAKKSTLGVIDGYEAGIVVLGSTHNVEFQTISNCVDGVIIRADTNRVDGKSSLDNVIKGIQIGKCSNGIIFEQNADKLVQQGNEIRINFVSETPRTLLFRNFQGFAHTTYSNWDSNFVELVASDPITLPESSMVKNETQHGVPNLVFNIKSWCGGWVPDTNTICLIRGKFMTSTFVFSLAQRVGLSELVDIDGVASFGSCIFKTPRYHNLGAAESYVGTSPEVPFNNGKALVISKYRIKFSIPDLNPGSTYGSSFRHVISQRANTGRNKIIQTIGTRGQYLIEVQDAGTESQGLVRVWFTNITQTTIAKKDVEVIFETC